MSLNGLDDPAVIDAYQTALTEAGGWLLLKYASRDEVTLHGRGTGGVADVRASVEGYEEKSPLYGFLQYRRRKIVLKYAPDGMSRLVQARTTVQFQSILDKFSPQDTTFEFKAPTDLTESALSSACLLHAVSGSITSSSSSLRRRRLMEIAEDAEEGPPPSSLRTEAIELQNDSDNKRLSQLSDATAVPPPKKEDTPSIAPSVVESEADTKVETASIKSSVSRRRFLDQFHRDSFDRRGSSQSARPTLQELHQAAPYPAPYRQKVKLDQRPSVDISNRPRTAGSMSRGQDNRPVAALPAGVRSRKPPSHSSRPKSTPDVPPVPTLASLRNAPPMPVLIPPPTLSMGKPKLSPGAKSMTAIPSSGMSPEKQRLMKALELRKKQMEKKSKDLQNKEEQKNATTILKSTVEESLENKENMGHSPVKKTPNESTSPEVKKMETQPSIVTKAEHIDQKPLSADIAKADSAVEMVIIASKGIEPPVPQSEELSNGIVHHEEHANDVIQTFNDKPNENKDFQPVSEPETLTPVTMEHEESDTPRVSKLTLLSEKESVTKRTEDLESLISKLPDSPRTEEAETEEGRRGEQNGGEQNEEEEEEEPETKQIHDENASSDAISKIKDTEINTPAIVVSLRAEDIPLPPPDSGEDLAEVPQPTRQSHSQTALEPVSTAQMQPLPLPQPAELELELEDGVKHKRIALLEPIQVPTPELSDDENFLSDDSLMEELTSATVQEAQPVTVGKGPLSSDQTRAVSNPGRPLNDFGSLPSDTRSISATYVDSNNQSLKPMVAKKVNVSSGISKRIKALEMFSNNRDNLPNAPGSLVDSTASGNVASPAASAFEKFRKRASVSLNGNLPSAIPSTRSSFISTAESTPLNRSDSRSLSKTNSVSVTARIVRDPSTPPESNTNPMEPTVLGLQRSPLIVRHDSSETTPLSDQASSDDVPELRHNTYSGRSSSRHSTDTTIAPRSSSRTSSQSRFDDRGRGELASSPNEKKDSHKQQLPPSPAAEAVMRSSPSQAIDIGEVNVQFPDTLLWKRRFLRIDDQGYLVLTPGNTDTGARNIVKRYHLSEFKTPCLPDEERQELPNSILLDFRDGNTLQCACESRTGQAAALKTLVDAHNTYNR